MIIKKYTPLFLLLSLIGQTLAMEQNNQPTAITTIGDTWQYVISRMFLRDETLPIEQLCDAISNGNMEEARELLDQGVDPNTQNCIGVTPLYRAATRGDLNTCKLLIKYGANPECPSLNSKLPLHGALSPVNFPVDKNHNDVAIYFIEDCKVNPNTKCASQDTFLHQTAFTGNTEILKILLQKSAHPNVTDVYNNNPLHYAAFPCRGKTDEQSIECIMELLCCGVDYKIKNQEGKTPVQCATSELVQKALKDDSSVKKLLISSTNHHEKNLCIAVMERRISGKQMRHKEFDFKRTEALFLGNK